MHTVAAAIAVAAPAAYNRLAPVSDFRLAKSAGTMPSYAPDGDGGTSRGTISPGMNDKIVIDPLAAHPAAVADGSRRSRRVGEIGTHCRSVQATAWLWVTRHDSPVQHPGKPGESDYPARQRSARGTADGGRATGCNRL